MPFWCSRLENNQFLPWCISKRIEHVIERMCAFGDVLECAFLSLWSLFRSAKLRQYIYESSDSDANFAALGHCLVCFFLAVSKCGSCSNNAFHFPSMWTWSRAHSRDSTPLLVPLLPFHSSRYIKFQTEGSHSEKTISARFPLWKFPMLSGSIAPQTWQDKFTHALKSLIWHLPVVLVAAKKNRRRLRDHERGLMLAAWTFFLYILPISSDALRRPVGRNCPSGRRR